MFYALRSRARETLEDVIDLLEDMALIDSRRALTTPDIGYHSTASAPSLRRATDTAMPTPNARPKTADGDAGNVKVVVRVRKFIKRGVLLSHTQSCISQQDMVLREGQNSTERRHV